MRRHTARSVLAGILLLVGLLPQTGSSLAQAGSRTFPETGKTVRGQFLQYWETHGALTQQGFPISDELQERSATDGKSYTVQYFERAVFEQHLENQPPYDVLLQLVGVFFYHQRYPQGAPGAVENNEPGSIRFEQTGHRLGGLFLDYWRGHGGLMQQGYPISGEFMERNDLDGKTYKVQYFERAVFEYHPENTAPNNVLLSQLGKFRYRALHGGAPPPTTVASRQLITSHDALPQPALAKPASGVPFSDPVFGTRVMRITDARAAGLNGLAPDYSKRQAWNADESLLLLHTGDGNSLLYDGSSYQFRKQLDGVGGEDVFWHPAQPSTILYSAENTLYSYEVTTDERTQIASFPQYAFANTRGEGNLSRDGRWYAFAGQLYDSSSGEVTIKDLVLFDVGARQMAARVALPTLDSFDWVSVSPLGNYVVADYADTETGHFHGVEVYDRNFRPLWQKPLGFGHSDLAVEADGTEVLVIDLYDEDTNSTYIMKYRLADGQETRLLQLSWLFDLHISCRNEQQPGWCFISTFDSPARLSDDSQSWLPFEDEVFALKLDGSGDVQRLAHHHSRRYSPSTPDSDTSDYWAEPHATVNRKGDRILFGSNWRENVADVTGVDTYEVDWR